MKFVWYIDLPIVLVSAAGGAYLLWLMFLFGSERELTAALLPLLGLAITFLLATVIHELGHLVAGWLANFRMRQFTVFALVCDLENRKVRLWSRSMGGEWLGYVAYGLRDGTRPTSGLRWRLAAFVAAGPVANLLMFPVGVLAANLLQPEKIMSGPGWLRDSWSYPLLFPGSFWVLLCGQCAAMGLWLGLLSFLPITLKSGPSDGQIILGCVRGESPPLRSLANEWARSALARGIRPRDWDRDWVARLEGEKNGTPEQISASVYRYYVAEDEDSTHEAEKWLDAAGEGTKHPFQQAIQLETAYFVGFHRGNAGLAAAKFEKVNCLWIEDHTRLRAEAAVRGAEGKLDEALALVEKALAAVPRSLDPGGAIAERDWLERMKGRYLAELEERERVRTSHPSPSETPS